MYKSIVEDLWNMEPLWGIRSINIHYFSDDDGRERGGNPGVTE